MGFNTIFSKYVYRGYAVLFARPSLWRFNKVLYNCSLRGLGILNYQGKLTGEHHFLKKYLSKVNNPIVLDVGANIGNYSKTVMEINNSATVHAFEPLPKNYEQLNQIDNINSYNLGCSDENGSIKFYNFEGGSTFASIYQDVIESIHKKQSIEFDIDVIKLDDFISSNDIIQIDLLKIDTEGHELAVLHGASNAIKERKMKAIHFEFNVMNVISRVFFKDIFDLLENYSFYRMLPTGLVKLDYNTIDCEIFAYQNIVAILED